MIFTLEQCQEAHDYAEKNKLKIWVIFNNTTKTYHYKLR
jgi:hypothetical protein